MIKIKDLEFENFISECDIDDKISELAIKIDDEFEFEIPPVFVGVLDGSFRFMSDLAYHVNVEAEWCFLKVASYDGTKTTGEIKELIGLKNSIEGKVVIIVEDIVDTGNTLEYVMNELRNYNPSEIRVMALLRKPDSYQKNYKVDYVGFDIPNDFVVGYGLDYDGYGRGINEIYKLKNNGTD